MSGEKNGEKELKGPSSGPSPTYIIYHRIHWMKERKEIAKVSEASGVKTTVGALASTAAPDANIPFLLLQGMEIKSRKR